MTRDERWVQRGLIAGSPHGWRWIRFAETAGMAGILTAAVVTIAGSMLKLVDQGSPAVTALLWVSAGLTLVGAAAAVLAKWAQLHERRLVMERQWLDSIMRMVREMRGSELPRLSQIPDDAMGPTPTRYSKSKNAPYVGRPAVDTLIRDALDAIAPPFPIVLIWGPSKSGKSRTAVEAVRVAFGQTDPLVVIPNGGQSLADLSQMDPPLPIEGTPALVWIDDATVADLGTLSGLVLDWWQQRAVCIVTITADRYREVVMSTGEVTAAARSLLRRAIAIEQPFELTELESAEAQRLYPDERFAGNIAETLVGGEQLVAKYRSGRDTNPSGFAVVQAAVDARRAGIGRPLTEPELHSMFPLYLRRTRIDLEPTTSRFADGLAWASEPVASHVAMLTAVHDPILGKTWRVLDYVVAADDGENDHQPRELPAQTWEELPKMVPPHDAYNIGVAAYLARLRHVSVLAMRIAACSDDPDVSAEAAASLGFLLQEEGDLLGAQAAYSSAVDARHRVRAPSAAVYLAAGNLGVLRQADGDKVGAREAYQLAMKSEHLDVARTAAFNLGVLLHQLDPEAARSAYLLAVGDTDHQIRAKAAFNLGVLLEQQDTVAASNAYRLAIDIADPQIAAEAAFNLGVLRQNEGDLAGAISAYQLAAGSHQADVAAKAAARLGLLV
ncbi:MAG TPA: tetratricopeptide repeat protein [Candidatus Limnocylindrales bacterium]|nr:tetratricopeptide repeat protein [Candidatus Limnocylindrales bacterium]